MLRALSLAKYLPGNGVRVDVLTARNAPAVGKDLTLLQQVPSEVTIHRTWTLDLPFWLRKSVKKALTGGRAKAASPAPQAGRSGGNPLRRWIGNLLLPDPQVGWLPFALPAAVRIIRERSIDAVLITVPPYSSVKVVMRLRRLFPDLPIVLDFRDEWLTTTLDLVSFNNNDRARLVAQSTEREAVHAATTVVLVTEAARCELQSRYPDLPPESFVCIHNGYDATPPQAQARFPGLSSSRQKVVLTYIGSVYGSTDPGSFIEAVRALPEAVRSRLHVRFIGHIEAPEYREQLLSLGDTIELKGFVPQAEALAAIRDTDYLLLITHDRINVAAKFYDYLGGGKPILGAVHPQGDVRRLLEETRAGNWADVGDPQSIRRMLIEAIEASGTFREPDFGRIAEYHRRPLTARYASLLRGLVESGQNSQKGQAHS
ncbi:glycosyltransferase [Edaphobacter modestus]|uniref:glycosyltransferase n=1 Tax=Edaphobacter modestus TaxID=388466 RepID=UPI001F5E6B50|nr:glycosyltransferase [Edaphobacter modestus]